MTVAEQVRCAFVEYQPNLEQPAEPVRLGVIVEHIGEDISIIGIIGRVPIGEPPELQLEGAWGPFREVATGWQEAIFKTVRESIGKAEPGDSVLDLVAQQWRWNLYVTEPETETKPSDIPLEDYAVHRCAEYLGEAVIDVAPPEPTRRHRSDPWLKSRSVLEEGRRAVVR